ncbi:MAG: hypothetical protein PHP92_05745, partial [Candidatus Nanoarchaeia archaeon]|nr:hypothetical protein [Candidatus Nanoarchaeia archaeon]
NMKKELNGIYYGNNGSPLFLIVENKRYSAGSGTIGHPAFVGEKGVIWNSPSLPKGQTQLVGGYYHDFSSLMRRKFVDVEVK